MGRKDEDMEDATNEPAEASQESEPIDAPSPDPPMAVSGGRRRGRRKVMRKKTIKDEEGYLGWCSTIAVTGLRVLLGANVFSM